MKQCLLELGEFKQKESETIELYYNRLNELIFKCNRCGVTHSTLEYNLTFMVGLRKELRNISLIIKTQKSFDGYSLGDLYNFLKANESEINEIAEEGKISLEGPLDLMSKVSKWKSKMEVAEQVGCEDEGLFMNWEDEAVAYYSNNKVKIFFKKPFNPKYKSNNEFKANTSYVNGTRVDSEEEKKERKSVVEKVGKKLKGDLVFDHNYYNGANHLAVDCML